MKKLNKLFAILFAVLGMSAAAKAYTTADLTAAGWSKVESITDVANYYYVFVDAGTSAYMIADNQIRTRAYYLDLADPTMYANLTWILEANNDSYALKNAATGRYYNSGNYGWDPYLGATNDNANYKLTLADGKYSIQSVKTSSYLGPWNNNGAVVGNGENIAANKNNSQAPGFLIYSMERSQYDRKLATAFDQATDANPIDLTSRIDNPDADWADYGLGGWTTANTIVRHSNGFFEFCNWGSNSWNGSMTQTITSLPNGKYKVTASGQASATDVVVTLTANGESTNLACKGEGWQDFVVECAVVAGELTITVDSKGSATQRWANVDNFTIAYCGKDLTIYENALNSAIVTAQSIDQSKLNEAVRNILNNAITDAQEVINDINKTVETLEEQTGLLSEAISLSNSIVAPYASLLEFIDLCISYASEDYSNVATSDVRTKFNTAITTATNNGNAATTVAALNNAYSTLEVARQEYVKEAIPTTGNSFDMTFMMTNPQVASATGWTNGGTANGQQYTGAPDNTYLDFYQVTRDMNQTLSGLPSGSYFVKVATRGHADVAIGYIYVQNGENKITEDIYKVGANGNTLGNGWGWTTTGAVAVTNGQLTIGFYAECGSGQWVGADNFSLYRAYDESLTAPMQASVSSLKTEAEGLLEKAMNNSVKVALTDEIGKADASSTNPFALDATIVALSTAIANAEASIAAYEAISAYIAKANKIDESIAADYQTAYDDGTLESAETVFQELEVATYNYVMTNFTYPVALSDTWNSTGTNTAAGTFSNEHWSGKTREYQNQQDGDNWGWGASSWSIDFDQDVTLPEGEYVFKVAGRKSAGTTLELVVTMGETELGTVNDFPSSNNTIGINKAGAASFDPEDPAGFANNGAGYGWQWRYVKFTLDAEATVKVAVHAETNAAHNWVSFGDYTLQMTEETYLDANKGALDAPTAAAEALVDTKPMGAAENTALKDALAMPVKTGAELLAKIEALETAVANANAWVAAYNEAKAPLVAALERFETDYNDAENGALDHMAKSRWDTAIEKAQAAAVAKDVTDSYEGFEAATANLVAALDAATVSVGEYADLKSAIENANTIINGGNIGDGPFQRPQSAVDALGSTDDEQAVYDAAEKDGEEVTSLTEALRKGSVIELNAPEEGARYNMVMSYAGWEHDGKAVTYLAGGRNDAGLYNIQYYAAPNANYAQAFTFTAVEGKTNCYTLSMTDVDGNERYVCTGVPYGGSTSQLRTTTNAEAALVVEVIATTTDGIHNLYNTEAKNYIGGQDAGFYTVNSHTTFRLQEAAKANVTLTLSKVGWATLILPFDAELPEGVKAYSCTEATGETLTLTEAESLKANTPYLMNGEESTHVFTGYGLADKDSYTDGLFVGTYVDYQTTADGKTYVLQNNNGNLAFYLVQETAQPWIRTNRCYMIYEAANGAPVFRIGKGTTGIAPSTLNAQPSTVIYDLMGRKVTTMMKGGMYIVNGKKVVIR